jgi:D-lactate dehydrogenase
MRVALFGAKPYDRAFFNGANREFGHDLVFIENPLNPETVPLAAGADAVCVFVNDDLGAVTLEGLHGAGIRVVALRCAGFNNVDLGVAARLGLTVVRVPAYSPHGVAEHAVALLLTLVRKTHKAYARVREGNFALDGLLGHNIHGLTVGVIGTGQIGAIFARIMAGFGCRILAHDVRENPEVAALPGEYVSVAEILGRSDIISLHCPLLPATRHLINEAAVEKMKPGVVLINTSRGALVDAEAVIGGIKSGKIGGLGLDVYEEEAGLFFEDKSQTIIQDDVLSRLLTFPNVLITGHQAFFTREAIEAIAMTTLQNLRDEESGSASPNRVKAQA